MKGKIKVEFIDKDGNARVAVEKHNVVTNAAQNIFKAFINYWAQMNMNLITTTTNAVTALGSATRLPTNIATDLFGGLLVFSDNLDNEAANHIMPTADDILKAIGCANQETSSNATTKGTLNTAETEITDSYAKFVWNFTAGELYNKDIGAFALTSNLGGQVGLIFDESDTNYRGKSLMVPISDMYVLGTTTTIQTTNLLPLSQLSASISNQNSKAVYYDADTNTITFGRYYRGEIRKRTLDLSKFKLDLNYDAKFGASSADEETTLAVTAITQSDDSLWSQPKGFSHYFYVAQRNPIGTASVVISRFDMLDGSETSLGTFNQDIRTAVRNWNSSYHKECIIEENSIPYMYIYAFNSAKDTLRVWKCNLNDGTFTYADTALSATTQTLIVASSNIGSACGWVFIDGTLYIPSNGSYVSSSGRNTYNLFRVNNDLTINQYPELQTEISPIYYDNIVAVPSLASEPWLFRTCYGNYAQALTPILYMPYFATIANLDAVLTKPADQGMKVTYTLYNN